MCFFHKLSIGTFMIICFFTIGLGCSGSGTGVEEEVPSASTSTVANPQFTPGPDTYREPFDVEITTSTEGAVIHYTLDDTTPTCSSIDYLEPITINVFDTITTMQAIACKEGMTSSGVVTAVYTLDTAWKDISSYNDISCGVRTDGTLWCWGYDKYSYLQTLGASVLIEPLQIGSSKDWNDVEVGYEHICAVKTDSTLHCWGENDKGQLGLDSTDFQDSPQQVTGNWKKVSTGYYHTCGIKTDDTLWCWGKNSGGEIGDNSTIQKNGPIQVESNTWSNVSAGREFTCGIKSDETLWCWGDNSDYKLGNGTTNDELLPFNTSSQSFKDVVAGIYHVCAIKTDGTLWCWGANNEGEVGNNDSGNAVETPLQIGTATNWIALAAEEYHTCAVAENGDGYCWGYNDDGRLGTGGFVTSLVPTKINGSNWSQFAAGNQHSCGLKEDGSLFCWGNNRNGQTGNGEAVFETTPVQETTESTDWMSVTASSKHTCAKKLDGSIWCWGNGQHGQLGVGYLPGYESLDPTEITAPAGGWLDISSYNLHTCGIKNDGSAYCWGYGPQGQIGNGVTSNHKESPTTVSGSLSYQDIDTGGLFSCAINSSDVLYCWGSNQYGQLGINSIIDTNLPTVSSDPVNWLLLGLGENHACGIRTTNDLYCWGKNQYGQVGDVTTGNNKLVPVHINAAVSYDLVSAGKNHTCAISLLPTPNVLQCWGKNDYGELGQDVGIYPLISGPTTVQMLGYDDDIWETVDAGENHTCAIQLDGTLWCWGYNLNGELGDDTKDHKEIPTQETTNSSDWDIVSAGQKHTCAIKTDGTLWCWGYNNEGQLGNGTYGKKTSPVEVVEP